MPIEESTNCEEHSTAITEMQTTLRNGRIVAGMAGSALSIIIMFTGWVANDHLAGIRGDLKEAKGMLQTIQRDTDKLGLKVGYLEDWKAEVTAHMKGGK